MSVSFEATKQVLVQRIETQGRFIPPTEKQISEMAKSFAAHGQQQPVIVRRVTSEDYKVVAGATRVLAARELGWRTILACVIRGEDRDYLKNELLENLERKGLTAIQKREIKKKLKELQTAIIKETLAEIPSSTGGRGKRGGAKETARRLGITDSAVRGAVGLKPQLKNKRVAVSSSENKQCPTCGRWGYRVPKLEAAE